MPRDYKDVSSRSSPKKRTAKKATRKRVTKKKVTPGWVWMLTGLTIGLLLAGGLYIYDKDDNSAIAQAEQKPSPKVEKNTPSPKATSTKEKEVAKTTAPKEEEPEQHYDFYTLLPQREVVIPESEILEEQKKFKPKENVAYMIQVGSFRKYGDADRLKAELAMIGIEADIDPISTEGGEWLRVRIGPFTDTRKLNKVRNKLHSNNINTLLVKINTDKT